MEHLSVTNNNDLEWERLLCNLYSDVRTDAGGFTRCYCNAFMFSFHATFNMTIELSGSRNSRSLRSLISDGDGVMGISCLNDIPRRLHHALCAANSFAPPRLCVGKVIHGFWRG